MTADVEPSAGIEFLWRTNTGNGTSSSSVAGTAPNWVRLTRTNNNFRAYYSFDDGYNWTQLGSTVVISNMPVGAYIGLAVCSHANGTLNTSVMDNVSASFLPANAAPTLAPIANQAVNVGQTVALTASATDTNIPSQTLAFSLLTGPASSLTQINNTNAVFNWRPSVTDARTTNLITLKVADNGWPSLSATQSFMITVNPLTLPVVSSAALNGGRIQFQVNGDTGPDYAVQVSSNLFDWSTRFITNSPALPWTWTETNPPTLPTQFYRIKAGPPLP